jgi:enamine deaminase RidA (YjgF/YER057c/UK114 family)
MIKHSVELYPNFKVFVTSVHNQLFISVSVTKLDENPGQSAEEIYNRIAKLLSTFDSKIIHERCFGSIEFQKQILEARNRAIGGYGMETNTPVTFIEGESCLKSKFAGVQIRALIPGSETRVWTILDRGIPKGRGWNHNGSTFLILQNVDGGNTNEIKRTDRKFQSEAMFHQADRLLRAEGASYQDVVRTWIYISDILDWYSDFNTVRNRCYSEYGFLGNTNSELQAEQIYLPASTGIEGKNPSGLPVTMDVFAINRSRGNDIQVHPIYGVKQRSPFRYGSAFSRATVVKEPGSKLILVSGTASIDDQGKSTFIGDSAAQIRQTLNVVSELVASENATLQDLCEATVFIKRKEDFAVFQKVIEDMGISNIPSVNVLANVCRDELLFELDAAFILEQDSSKSVDNS